MKNGKGGHWIREWRGIYRLSQFPQTNDSHLVVWALWSQNRNGEMQGVYSHETALMLFELSDTNPAKLHMTVPPKFRRTANPAEMLQLHFGIIQPNEYENRQ